MTLGDLLIQLHEAGVSLRLDGKDGLHLQGPRGAIDAVLRQQLVKHKPLLLQWLREHQFGEAAPLPQCVADPDNLYEPFPLSDLQMGFYMADDPYMEFHVRPHYYIEKQVDDLDIARYEAAWNKALHRHRNEIVTVLRNGQLQTVSDPVPLRIVVNDWRSLPVEQAQRQLLQLREQLRRAQLPLDHWPWIDLRVSLWRQDGAERTRLHYNHNNFFSDGYGTTRLLQEVDRYYADPALQLPALTLSFRDAAMALEAVAASDSGQASRRYWEQRLPDLPDAVPLALKPAMIRRCRSKLERREGFIDAALWTSLKKRAQELGLTPSSALFAAYAEVLACWSNSRHFLLSNMMTRRLNLHPEMNSIVGNFASLYPLEVDLRNRRSFCDSAVRLQEQISRDASHTQWGGMRVMQALNHLRHEMGSAPVPFVIGSGLFMLGFERSDYSCLETSQVMLDHQFWELSDGRLYWVWDVLEDFFPAAMIDDMWSAYSGFLQQLATTPLLWEQDRIDLLPQRQRDQRRQSPIDPATVPGDGLGHLLPAADRSLGRHTAVICGDTRLSYAALARGARAIAASLHSAGIQAGDRVAIVADRNAGWLCAVHGAQSVGAVHVPIDPDMPLERCGMMLANCEARTVLCSRRHRARDWPACMQVIEIEGVGEAPDGGQAFMASRGEQLAYIIYTSGSTGQPKGVMIDHRGALNTIRDVNQRFGISTNDRIFGVSSIGFDLSVYDVFGSAEAGATLVFPEPEQMLNPSHWLDVLAAQRVTVWNSAPALAMLMADAALARKGFVLADLRLVMLSGDWIALDLPGKLRRIAPHAKIVSLGGATEASIWSIAFEIDAVDPSWSSVPYGYPMRNQSWQVLDERGLPAPEWVAGDLHIAGIGLAKGYWNDPVKTQAAFNVHPDGQRLYRTGDRGRYLPGGLIEFLGRRDMQVKVQGHRIELGEVEAALSSHEAVQAAVAIVHGGGPGQTALLAAYVVARPGHSLSGKMLNRHVQAKLPRYMVPSQITVLPELPLTPNGKIDRKVLQRQHPMPLAAARTEHAQRPPSNATEIALLGLWSQVLGRDITAVGGDFFDMGGQSFEAVRLVGLIHEAFGTRLSLGDVWQHRRIDQLADLIQRQAAPGVSHLRTLADAGTDAPLYLVHPAGGQVVCYRHLANALNRPVHAFEAVGDMPEDLPAMAALYVRELMAHPPQGPLLLGGWSSGGPIAFEMAVQLRQLQREVQAIVIIDCPAPFPLPQPDPTQLLQWFAEDLQLDTATGGRMQALPDHLEPIYQHFETIVRANRAYSAPVVDMPILVLRADSGQVSEFALHPQQENAHWGWAAHTRATTTTWRVAGTHHSLLTHATAGVCAAAISTWLDRLGH